MKTRWKPIAALLLCLLLASCQQPEPASSVSSPGGHGADLSALTDRSSGDASSGDTSSGDASSGDASSGETASQPSGPEVDPDPPEGPETTPAGEDPTQPPLVSEPDPNSQADPPPAQNNTLHILMYHHFVPEGQECNTWTVTNTRFREDLQWLADHGYTTVLPGELAAGKPLPQRAVMITMDDGYESNYWLAFPLLKEFQAKAAIALITSHIDEGELYYLNWNQCREMAQSGLVEFGSHTHAVHGSEYGGIQRAPEETLEEYEARIFPDIQTSIDLMEAYLETAPLFFAYPLGKTEPWAASFLQDHFSVTVTTRHGSADVSQGLYCMNRYTVEMSTPLCGILPA